jgi:hypothetical protein
VQPPGFTTFGRPTLDSLELAAALGEPAGPFNLFVPISPNAPQQRAQHEDSKTFPPGETGSKVDSTLLAHPSRSTK